MPEELSGLVWQRVLDLQAATQDRQSAISRPARGINLGRWRIWPIHGGTDDRS